MLDLVFDNQTPSHNRNLIISWFYNNLIFFPFFPLRTWYFLIHNVLVAFLVRYYQVYNQTFCLNSLISPQNL